MPNNDYNATTGNWFKLVAIFGILGLICDGDGNLSPLFWSIHLWGFVAGLGIAQLAFIGCAISDVAVSIRNRKLSDDDCE